MQKQKQLALSALLQMTNPIEKVLAAAFAQVLMKIEGVLYGITLSWTSSPRKYKSFLNSTKMRDESNQTSGVRVLKIKTHEKGG